MAEQLAELNKGDLEVYSENERQVGVWIDGKPIYQKVIVDTLPTTAETSKRINLGVAVDKGIRITGTFLNTINMVSYPVPYYAKGDYYLTAIIRTNSDVTAPNTLQYSSTYSTGMVYFIVEYTKV